ncbi:MAG TPA: iron ABC transporter permease, partial [Spirochaetia bacterium]|nr:iron ABC transporter permease [Spirochaetia bacterium]
MTSRGRSGATGLKGARMMIGEPLLVITIIALFYALLVFVVLPIAQVLIRSVSVKGHFSLENYLAVFSKSYLLRPFLNSMLLGFTTACSGTIVGFVFAYAITRTPMPFKRFFRLTATFPIVSPPFVVALAGILLFGRAGMLTPYLEKVIGPFSIYGLGGLVLVETIAYAPLGFLVLVGVLQAIDPALEEAAMDLGASRLRVFGTVTLPLAVPGVAAAWLLVFIESVADFGNPMVLSGNFSVLSVQAYLQITGAFNLSSGATLAVLLLLPTAVAYAVQKYLVSRRSYVTVTGRPTGAVIRNLEWYIKLPVYGLTIIFTAVVVLFYGMVAWGSFQKLWGVDATLTLANYVKVFHVGKGYIVDSLVLSAIAAPISGILGMVIAFLIIRRRFIGRRVMEFVSMLTFAVPGTVVGIGYILAFNQPSPVFPFILTGSGTIIVALLVFRYMPAGIQSGIAALQQIDPSIEEASADLGAGAGKTFIRVTLPMIAPAFFSGLVYGFVKAMTAISAIIFVVSGSWNLITVAILGYVDNSQYAQAAAM